MPRHCVVCIDNKQELAECPCGGGCEACVALRKDIASCDCTEADAPIDKPEPFVIEKGVPIPTPFVRNPHGDLLRAMDVGYSIFFEDEFVNSIRHYIRKLKKQGKTFTQRTVPGGYRVWRIK